MGERAESTRLLISLRYEGPIGIHWETEVFKTRLEMTRSAAIGKCETQATVAFRMVHFSRFFQFPNSIQIKIKPFKTEPGRAAHASAWLYIFEQYRRASQQIPY